jgi:hypothetical protein
MRICDRSIPRRNELGALESRHRQRRLGKFGRGFLNRRLEFSVRAPLVPHGNLGRMSRTYETLVKVATFATIPQCLTLLLQRQNQVHQNDSIHE